MRGAQMSLWVALQQAAGFCQLEVSSRQAGWPRFAAAKHRAACSCSQPGFMQPEQPRSVSLVPQQLGWLEALTG